MSSGNEESSSCIHGTKASFFHILLDSETLSCMLAHDVSSSSDSGSNLRLPFKLHTYSLPGTRIQNLELNAVDSF